MKQKRIRGVFSELLENKRKKAAWDTLLYEVVKKDTVVQKFDNSVYYLNQVDNLRTTYIKYISEPGFRMKLQELANLELRMLQLNSLFPPILSFGILSQTRNNETTDYIICRSPFPYMDVTTRPEIRVYLGKLSDFSPKTLDEIVQSKQFIEDATQKMIQAMLEIIKTEQH